MTSTHVDLIQAAMAGDETAVEQWLSENGDKAAKIGHEAIVRRLLPMSDPKAKNSQALACAAGNGHEAIVRLLLPVSDPQASNSLALAWAAENGHEAIVRLLMPVSDLKANGSQALTLAVRNGHEAIVTILIESNEAVEAWRSLIRDKDWEVLDLLAPYMPEDTMKTVLKTAPAEAMPRTRAHRLNQTLAKTLAGAQTRSLRNRL